MLSSEFSGELKWCWKLPSFCHRQTLKSAFCRHKLSITRRFCKGKSNLSSSHDSSSARTSSKSHTNQVVLTVVLLYNVQIDTVFVINEADCKGFVERFLNECAAGNSLRLTSLARYATACFRFTKTKPHPMHHQHRQQ